MDNFTVTLDELEGDTNWHDTIRLLMFFLCCFNALVGRLGVYPFKRRLILRSIGEASAEVLHWMFTILVLIWSFSQLSESPSTWTQISDYSLYPFVISIIGFHSLHLLMFLIGIQSLSSCFYTFCSQVQSGE
ncbi:uncharacterized protein LOC130757262 [Actinidia eriantha]|uniref:uncharacterized protein LOC130757262 n=1 Tax=Actinidia eriantha TaxID=165200 RepID=UPI00258ACCB9|nr:uncharacterized protein LOC130757262 [Actinidia eriantha]